MRSSRLFPFIISCRHSSPSAYPCAWLLSILTRRNAAFTRKPVKPRPSVSSAGMNFLRKSLRCRLIKWLRPCLKIRSSRLHKLLTDYRLVLFDDAENKGALNLCNVFHLSQFVDVKMIVVIHAFGGDFQH